MHIKLIHFNYDILMLSMVLFRKLYNVVLLLLVGYQFSWFSWELYLPMNTCFNNEWSSKTPRAIEISMPDVPFISLRPISGNHSQTTILKDMNIITKNHHNQLYALSKQVCHVFKFYTKDFSSILMYLSIRKKQNI